MPKLSTILFAFVLLCLCAAQTGIPDWLPQQITDKQKVVTFTWSEKATWDKTIKGLKPTGSFKPGCYTYNHPKRGKGTCLVFGGKTAFLVKLTMGDSTVYFKFVEGGPNEGFAFLLGDKIPETIRDFKVQVLHKTGKKPWILCKPETVPNDPKLEYFIY